ncbi:DUF742 domain-containing protein [Allonocardiopsis opalescens]|uniref:Uncharacterized protein DUF742 n=1 Tax=Allonocardiopsis opalescens TaxID=1144618 RepID=A0A2T0PX26_9ACTN|nr:DUF742 domain-containing protein [Allonocardiopsis opalescens]PRX96082.1 uncharacterized protein DUF742 [Allonocardiopsis opalescens]
MSSSDNVWFDDEAGPLIRPYAMTRGRTQPTRDDFDVVSIVVRVGGARQDAPLDPEHQAVLDMCASPLSVAEIASHLDYPIGVVKVLLGDLLDQGLIVSRTPAARANRPSMNVLSAVLDGIRAL